MADKPASCPPPSPRPWLTSLPPWAYR